MNESDRRNLRRNLQRWEARGIAVRGALFERGWDRAIAMWGDGFTWEGIIFHKADEKSAEFSRGMIACVDAMSGWIDCARREAKVHGLTRETTEELVRRATIDLRRKGLDSAPNKAHTLRATGKDE